MSVRVRFAPSPTGFLHIGGARTALFNWLFARHHKGTFILRIEDTDKERSTQEAIDAIIDGMKWLGMDWDEGPFYQSQRTDLYKKALAELEEKGLVYRCYATPEELEEMRIRKHKGITKTVYDRRWRDKGPEDWPEGKPYTYRFKMPLEGETLVEDLVQGKALFKNDELEDFILVRADGSPTYSFSVVVDDIAMGITHIIRGADHLSNTPLQIHLYRAFGADPPKFAHVGLIHGPDGKKYSKRHGAVSVTAWRDMGYHPEALVNYLVRLGWSYGDQEIFPLDELIEKFDLDNVGKSASIMNEQKLLWMNQQYMQSLPVRTVAERLVPFLEKLGAKVELDEKLIGIVEQLTTRSKTLVEMAEGALFFYVRPTSYDEKAKRKYLKEKSLPALEAVYEALSALDSFDVDSIASAFDSVCERLELKLGKVAQPVRVAVAGRAVSPPIYETLYLLGKDESLQRIAAAIEHIRSESQQQQ